MDEQLWTPIAVALVTTTAESLAEGAKSAFTALMSLVRRRFERKPEAQAVFDAATDSPDDSDRIQELSVALQAAAAEDPEFADALQDAWREMSARIEAHDSVTINQITGAITGNVVQARDISGGISFGKR